ncbi:LysR family transcriptional regulator [Streptacidiphilus carbonis]|uniref:LysR substrate-binding domain-containing protein n=1 Tax=Streptacidiphilus carbonis TaxID=105422 RepID=UPI0005A792AE|nr:LysR family transcriptional regulator [Streptacidiphilus carbonis]
MDVHGRDLRYFAAVAQELHFTRAAELLFVSQPALSKQIRMLERALGAPLFDRDHREVRLTAVGTALLPHARRMLEQWTEAERAVAAAKAAARTRLVIGMSTGPGRNGMLPAIRSRFTADHPDAQLVLRQVDWTDPSAGLADGSSDVAFVWLPQPEPERLGWVVVAQEPRLVALPESHPLAGRESVDFAELLDQPFLALPPTAGVLRDHWLATDERGGREPLVGAEISGVDETYEALVGGQGVCLLGAGNAPLLTRGGVVTLPVRGLSPSRFALAWRAGDTRPMVHAYAKAAQAAHPCR